MMPRRGEVTRRLARPTPWKTCTYHLFASFAWRTLSWVTSTLLARG
jgi:hypothetical protein